MKTVIGGEKRTWGHKGEDNEKQITPLAETGKQS